MQHKSMLLVLTVILLNTVSKAQTEYRPGYVTFQGGVKIKGLLNFHERVDAQVSFKFKSNMTVKPIDCNLSNIEQFQLEDSIKYIKAEVLVHNPVIDIQTNKAVVYKTVTTQFLKVLITGDTMSLYFLPGEERYFIEDRYTPKRYQELIYWDMREHLSIDDGMHELVEDKKHPVFYYGFRDLLKHYLSRSDPYNSMVDHMPFEQEGLKQVVYHINNNKYVSYDRAGEKVKVLTFFAGGGAAQTRVSVTRFEDQSVIHFKPVIAPCLLGGIDIKARKYFPDLLLRLSFMISRYNTQYSGKLNDHVNIINYSFHFLNVTPKLGIFYNFVGKIENKNRLLMGLELAFDQQDIHTGDQRALVNGVEKQDISHNQRIFTSPISLYWDLMYRTGDIELLSFVQIQGSSVQDDSSYYGRKGFSAGLTVSYHFK